MTHSIKVQSVYEFLSEKGTKEKGKQYVVKTLATKDPKVTKLFVQWKEMVIGHFYLCHLKTRGP